VNTKKPTMISPAFSNFERVFLQRLAARGVIDASSSSLCAIHSTGYVLADAADRIAARAKGNQRDEDGGGGCEETCGHIGTPLLNAQVAQSIN
jgi:hypothetical protein